MTDATVPPAPGAAAKLLLIVDDEFDVTGTYSLLFEYHGYRTITAGNGREALALAEQQRPDLVLSDYMMPVMDGAQLCRAWRQNPLLAPIPFVLTSAGLVRDLDGLPYDAFFRKPAPFDQLLAEIGRLIQASGGQGTGRQP
jgi:CheY-like chemotaxis protein